MRVIFQGASKGSLLKDHKQMPDEQKGLIYTENHYAAFGIREAEVSRGWLKLRAGW